MLLIGSFSMLLFGVIFHISRTTGQNIHKHQQNQGNFLTFCTFDRSLCILPPVRLEHLVTNSVRYPLSSSELFLGHHSYAWLRKDEEPRHDALHHVSYVQCRSDHLRMFWTLCVFSRLVFAIFLICKHKPK